MRPIIIDAAGRAFRVREGSLEVTQSLRETAPWDPLESWAQRLHDGGIVWTFDAVLSGGLRAVALGKGPLVRDLRKSGRAVYRLPQAARVSPVRLTAIQERCPWCDGQPTLCSTMADADLHFICSRGHRWSVGRF